MVHANEQANSSKRFEALARAGRTIAQNVGAVAVLTAASAIVTVGPSDLESYLQAGGQAAVAAVLAYFHNLVAPRKQS